MTDIEEAERRLERDLKDCLKHFGRQSPEEFRAKHPVRAAEIEAVTTAICGAVAPHIKQLTTRIKELEDAVLMHEAKIANLQEKR